MSMPREINGNQLVGTQNEAVPTRLIFNAEGKQRTDAQAIYLDHENTTWYVKKGGKFDTALEACSSNLFSFLTNAQCCPEVRLIQEDSHSYLMSKYTEFTNFDNARTYDNLEMIILASSVLSDGDCVNNKNIKSLPNSNDAFRFDFGAALHTVNNADIPLMMSVSDLQTGFSEEKYKGKLDIRRFEHHLSQMVNLDINRFDWKKWADAAGDQGHHIYEMRDKIQERIHLMREHFLQQGKGEPLVLKANEHELYKKLVVFYDRLRDLKSKAGEALFTSITPEILANNHLRYFRSNQSHPDIFMNTLADAYKCHDGLYSNLDADFAKYVVQQFPAAEFGVYRLPRIDDMVTALSRSMPDATANSNVKTYDYAAVTSSLLHQFATNKPASFKDEFNAIKQSLIKASSNGPFKRLAALFKPSSQQDQTLNEIIKLMSAISDNCNDPKNIASLIEYIDKALKEINSNNKSANEKNDIAPLLESTKSSLTKYLSRLPKVETDQKRNPGLG